MNLRQVVLVHPDSGAPWARLYPGRGETVLHAALRAGAPIRTTCRGSTICGLCRVEVREGGEGLAPAEPDERDLLGPAPPNVRLACRVELPDGVDRMVLAAAPAPG